MCECKAGQGARTTGEEQRGAAAGRSVDLVVEGRGSSLLIVSSFSRIGRFLVSISSNTLFPLSPSLLLLRSQ